MDSEQDLNELVQLIIESLEKKQIESVVFLIQDESQERINKIRKTIKQQNLLQLFEQAIKEVKKEQQKEQYQEKARQINRRKEEDSSEESVLAFVEKRRRKYLKEEEKFGYPFFGVVKSLMIAYGDLKPNEKAIKMMHSQIQTLFSKLLKEPSFNMKDSKGKVSKYFEIVFEEDKKTYDELLKVYKRATKGTRKQDEQFGSDQSDDGSVEEVDNFAIISEEEKKYFAELTSPMSEEQYQFYSDCRCFNFFHNKRNIQSVKKFQNFLGSTSLIPSTSHKLLTFLSFICCRFIKKVIFIIIRESNKDHKLIPLKQEIKSSDVTKVGNQIIDRYLQCMKKKIGEGREIEEKARNFFIEEFDTMSYRSVFPRKVVVQAQKEGSNSLAENIWTQNKHYRKMWIERINAEKEIQNSYKQLEKGQFDPQNEYTKFILKNYTVYQEKGRSFLWRKYFTQEPIQTQVENKPRKKTKLQSLNS